MVWEGWGGTKPWKQRIIHVYSMQWIKEMIFILCEIGKVFFLIFVVRNKYCIKASNMKYSIEQANSKWQEQLLLLVLLLSLSCSKKQEQDDICGLMGIFLTHRLCYQLLSVLCLCVFSFNKDRAIESTNTDCLILHLEKDDYFGVNVLSFGV